MFMRLQAKAVRPQRFFLFMIVIVVSPVFPECGCLDKIFLSAMN